MMIEEKKKSNFEIYYREYAQKLYGVALRMVNNHQDALDIVQECFLKAYQKWENFRGDATVSTWLYRITVNLSYDFLRKKTKERKVEMSENFVIPDKRKWGGEKEIFNQDIVEKIKNEIDKLTPKQKSIFILKTYEGLTYKEIADILHSRVGTVKATYFQTVQKIKRNLLKEEVVKNELQKSKKLNA